MTTAETTQRAPRYRVLVVDDEVDIRETIADVLSSEGYDVDTAHNGAEALRRMDAHAPDIVVVDLMMPVMNGWDFHERVRRDPTFASTPVVAVSAMLDNEASRRFNAYLRKPFDLDALLGVLHRCLIAA